MGKYLLAAAAASLFAVVATAADPDFGAFDKRLSAVESRLDALEGKAKADPGAKAGWDCGCVTFKDRCTCGQTCRCADGYRAAPAKDAAVYCVKGYHQGKETWLPQGYKMDGWVAADAMVSDCSSGACRMVKASDLYGAAPATYYQSAPQTYYSPPAFGSGFFRGGFGGGGCSGGSCR